MSQVRVSSPSLVVLVYLLSLHLYPPLCIVEVVANQRSKLLKVNGKKMEASHCNSVSSKVAQSKWKSRSKLQGCHGCYQRYSKHCNWQTTACQSRRTGCVQLKCLPCPSHYCRGPSESGRTASLVIVTQRVYAPKNLFDSK